jgi:hypothetical protein
MPEFVKPLDGPGVSYKDALVGIEGGIEHSCASVTARQTDAGDDWWR